MRRHIGGHAHGDAGAAIDEQIRERGGENRRFRETIIVVGHPVDGALVHIVHQRTAHVGEARLGITHGGGRIAFNAAEVSLPINERIANGPRLGHIYQRGINHRFAVGMVVATGVAANLGALEVLFGCVQRQFVHRVQDAALRGLETVARIGERAGDDDRHRVVEERVFNLVGDVDRFNLLVCGEKWSSTYRELFRTLFLGHVG